MAARYVVLMLINLLMIAGLTAQIRNDTVSLSMALQHAEEHFPLLKKDGHYERILQLKLENLHNRYLPDLGLAGQVSYQSDVVEFPFDIPGVAPLDLPHERLKASIEIQQIIYDGKLKSLQEDIEHVNTSIDKQEARVSLQQHREQVLNLFYSILISRKTGEIYQQSKDILSQKLELLEDRLAGGIIDNSGILEMKAEILSLDQKLESTSWKETELLDALFILTGKTYHRETEFELPEILDTEASKGDIDRPELDLLDLYRRKLEAATALQNAVNKPKVSAIAAGGLGYPNPYNFFDDKLSPFYMLGVQVQMPLLDWGESKRKKEINNVLERMIDFDKEALLQKINTGLSREQHKIHEMKAALINDRELITLRREYLDLVSFQLDKGIASTTDYIDALFKVQSAQLNSELHKVELSLAKASYLIKKDPLSITAN